MRSYFEKLISEQFLEKNCRYFTTKDSECICIEVYGDSKELGISDGQWDIYNELCENFTIVDWSFKQQKNQQCCLTIVVKEPKRLTRCTNPLGEILYIDNKTGEEYYGKSGMDKLLKKLNEEL